MVRILLIDDDEAIRFTLQRLLIAGGYEVVLAEDGRGAARIVEEQKIDLLITDMCMPEKEGMETIEEIRQTRPDLPIIAMSGGLSGLPESKERLLGVAAILGANAILPKPFAPMELYRTVGAVLDRAGQQHG